MYINDRAWFMYANRECVHNMHNTRKKKRKKKKRKRSFALRLHRKRRDSLNKQTSHGAWRRHGVEVDEVKSVGEKKQQQQKTKYYNASHRKYASFSQSRACNIFRVWRRKTVPGFIFGPMMPHTNTHTRIKCRAPARVATTF